MDLQNAGWTKGDHMHKFILADNNLLWSLLPWSWILTTGQPEQGSTLDLVVSPRTTDVSSTDTLTPLGTIDCETVSAHWRWGTAAPVETRCGRNIRRSAFEKTQAPSARTR